MKTTQIIASNANDLFVALANRILKEGIVSKPRNLKTIEINNVMLILTNPKKSFCNLEARAASKSYLAGEIAWYMGGSYDVSEIAKSSKFWLDLADKNGKIQSNYGLITFREKSGDFKNQFYWCLKVLAKDKNSRQAIININQPRHKKFKTKDFPCAIAQTFRIIDNELHCNVFIRSNDMIFGLTYDMPWFTLVQWMLLKELKNHHYPDLKLGHYNHFACSMHVYERHFKMLKDIATNPNNGREKEETQFFSLNLGFDKKDWNIESFIKKYREEHSN